MELRIIYKTLPHLRLREHYRRGDRTIVKAGDQAVSCEIVSPNNIKSYTQKSHQYDYPNLN